MKIKRYNAFGLAVGVGRESGCLEILIGCWLLSWDGVFKRPKPPEDIPPKEGVFR